MSFIRHLLEKSDASGSRSNILKPLSWFLSVGIAGIIALVKVNAQNWILILFSVLIVLGFLLFIFAYIFCLLKDRDALRSEKFSIQKLAIEKGLYGDDVTGLHLTDQNSNTEPFKTDQKGSLPPVNNK